MSTERETRLAVANAIKLGASLLGTLSVAIAVRLYLPRALGPVDFGRLHFAESLAALVMGLTAYGVDSYIGREVANDAERANTFFGGVVLVRAAGAAILSTFVIGTLIAMDKVETDWAIVALYCVWQLAFVMNASFAALLNAKGTVNELSVINVVGKLVWGGGIGVVLLLDGPLEAIPAVFILAEALKFTGLLVAVRRHLALQFIFDFAAGWAVVAGSIPYFLNGLAQRIYSRVDVYMLAAFRGDLEVGFYGVASNIANLVTLFLPVVNAVVLPMSARIAKQAGASEMFVVMRKTIRLAVVLASLIFGAMAIHAPYMVRQIFTNDYDESILPLQILAGIIPLTYFCTIAAMHLITLGKVWDVTKVSLIGLIANPALNAILIPLFGDAYGPGGGATGAAIASLGTEIVVAVSFGLKLGKDAIDKSILFLPLQLAALLGTMMGLELLLEGHIHWIVRGLLEVLSFVLVGGILGVLPVRDLARTVVRRLRRRGG